MIYFIGLKKKNCLNFDMYYSIHDLEYYDFDILYDILFYYYQKSQTN